MANNYFIKDPNATLEYQWDWSQWLGDDASITASTITVSTGIVLVSSSFTSTSAFALVSGGAAGETHTLRNRITTSGGEIEERTITLYIEDQ